MLDKVSQEVTKQNAEQLDNIERKEVAGEIEQAINALPEKQRAVFILRTYEDIPYDRISEILDISVSSAKTNHFYAVNKLQVLLEKRGVL